MGGFSILKYGWIWELLVGHLYLYLGLHRDFVCIYIMMICFLEKVGKGRECYGYLGKNI